MFSCSQLILLMCAKKKYNLQAHSGQSRRPLHSSKAPPTCFRSHLALPCSAAVSTPLLLVDPSTTTSTTRNNNPALRLACQGTFGTSVPTATQSLPASLTTVPIVLETTWPRETGTANTTGEGGKNNNNNNLKKKELGRNTIDFAA